MPTENQVKLAAIAHQWGGANYRDGISGPVKGVMLTFEQLENFAQALAASNGPSGPGLKKGAPIGPCRFVGTWEGRPIHEMTQNELLDVVENMGRQIAEANQRGSEYLDMAFGRGRR